MTELFKLLSDDTRLRMLMLLSEEELCVCQLSGILDLSQPKISKHLTKLRLSAVVNDDRREKFVFYSLDDTNDVLKDIIATIRKHRSDDPVLLKDLEGLKMKDSYLTSCGNKLSKLEV